MKANEIHRCETLLALSEGCGVSDGRGGVGIAAPARVLGRGSAAVGGAFFVSFLLYTTMFVAPIEVSRADGAHDQPWGDIVCAPLRVRGLGQRAEFASSCAEACVRLTPVRGRVTFGEKVTLRPRNGVRQILSAAFSFEWRPGELHWVWSARLRSVAVNGLNLIARFYGRDWRRRSES